MSLIALAKITKTYAVQPPVEVLHGVDLTVNSGECLAIVGRSGAGKSTLLNIMGLLDVPTSGSYEFDGNPVNDISEIKRDQLRAQSFGFVFQDFHILGHRTVIQNLELKLAIARIPRAQRPALIEQALHDVGLTTRATALGRLLSGGEKQRLAIARAMICSPRVIFADEPTGNLDDHNSTLVLDIFRTEADRGVAVVVITHDNRLSAWADRVEVLSDGRILEKV